MDIKVRINFPVALRGLRSAITLLKHSFCFLYYRRTFFHKLLFLQYVLRFLVHRNVKNKT